MQALAGRCVKLRYRIGVAEQFWLMAIIRLRVERIKAEMIVARRTPASCSKSLGTYRFATLIILAPNVVVIPMKAGAG
jgi:hypothetical protein